MQTVVINAGKKQSIEKITDRIKTFEDACEALGLEGEIFTGSFHDKLGAQAKHIIAGIKLEIIIQALNEKWFPDWENKNEAKFWCWWNMKGGFALDVVCDCCTFTRVGSRLCYKTRELATYAAAQFIELYKDYYTL